MTWSMKGMCIEAIHDNIIQEVSVSPIINSHNLILN
jgi:hypothetical protein